MRTWWPFIGRESELSRLLAALEEAVAGAGGVVLVTGEPGIGKTRLAEELAAQAIADGITVYWGRCWEAGGAPPFWPWIEVLRALPEAPVELLTTTAEVESPAAQRARFERFDAVAQFLTGAGLVRPVLIVLDDVHAADPSSLLLLEFLARAARTARLLVVAAYRPTDAESGAGAEIIERLRRSAMTLALTGLADAEIARLLAERTGSRPEQAQLRAVREATDGNPFLVTELAGLGPGEPLPAGVRQAAGRRLQPLPPPVRELLGIAAVGGRDIDPVVLSLVSGRAELDMLGQLETAQRAGILTRHGERLRFRHILLRDALEDGLDPATRRRLHA
ncbi:MAG TPA: AAA family ATPase, partial [Pseudonocardiaceae bacterium]|nr:AAA family ATPase [Pseudonocardiaceae bacterium]